VINDVLFEIPVYSCSQEQFVAHVTATADKHMATVFGAGSPIWQEQRDEEIQRHLHPIRYNELIGAIEVHRVGSQLRADYWFSEKSRIIIGSKQKARIRWCGKFLEKHYRYSKLSSPEIFHDFREALVEQIKGSGRLKRRCVDLTAFDRSGRYVDWRRILELGKCDG
jgi:hypothetical protein